MSFLLFEGVVALAVLLSLAELVNWWSILVLPAIVAGLVKINDIVAGANARSDITMKFTTRRRPGSVRGRAVVPDARRPGESTLGIDVPTEVIRIDTGDARPRTNRRRATNQRPFLRATDPHKRPGV